MRLSRGSISLAWCLAIAIGAAPWSEERYRVGTVRGPVVDALAGNDVIRARLEEWRSKRRAPFLVSRLSLGSELAVMAEYVRGRRANFSWPLATLRNNAGVYPATDDEAARFAEAYASAVNASDGGVVARHGGDYDAVEVEVLASLAPRSTCVSNRALEPFYFPRPWTAALRGARVLVVHPFAATIERQYRRHRAGERLWAVDDVLPAMDLVVVPAAVSLGAAPAPHGSWSETLAAMKAAIDAARPFDVALLGCGAYGLPLAHHVLRRGAPAVYVGGALQILFGIKGARWLDRPFFASRANAFWVWPAPEETPPGAAGVEGSAYWDPALGTR